jgi:predicted Zn-dependent protease
LDTLLGRRIPQGSLLDLAADFGLDLYDKRSGRGYEYQADDLGIQLMRRAGYNPQAAISVFKILQSATSGRQLPEFLQDHPITESRIHALVQKYQLTPQ